MLQIGWLLNVVTRANVTFFELSRLSNSLCKLAAMTTKSLPSTSPVRKNIQNILLSLHKKKKSISPSPLLSLYQQRLAP